MTKLNEIVQELKSASGDIYKPPGPSVWVAIWKISEAIELLAKQQEEMHHDEH